MKHLMKIASLVVVLVVIFVSNAFAITLLSPAVWDETYMYCFVRNSGSKPVDVVIEVCQLGSVGCSSPHSISLAPGGITGQSSSHGPGVYYCNFELSNKKVAITMCGDSWCMAVPSK